MSCALQPPAVRLRHPFPPVRRTPDALTYTSRHPSQMERFKQDRFEDFRDITLDFVNLQISYETKVWGRGGGRQVWLSRCRLWLA